MMRLMSAAGVKSERLREGFDPQHIRKIVLVRATYRIGDAVLATPAIHMFRARFPTARIDFVGGPICVAVLKHLPIDRHYSTTRRFPTVSWAYLRMLARIRAENYDLAIDVSASQSAMGAFIVKFSNARFKIGREGKWDSWFNLALPKPAERNKYRLVAEFLRPLLGGTEQFPRIVLSGEERKLAAERIASLLVGKKGPVVGMFVGGRATWGKRWPEEHFVAIANRLENAGANVIVFLGPEERRLAGFFKQALRNKVPVISEPSLRIFAAMVSCCRLFVSCDSGPMHLACAMNVRTVAVFIQNNFDHWGPPPELGRIVYDPQCNSPDRVLEVCLEELRNLPEEPRLQKTA